MRSINRFASALLAALLLLPLASCAPSISTAPTSAPTKEQVRTSTPTSKPTLTPSPTPTMEMISSRIIEYTEDMIFFPTDEELSRIEQEAKLYHDKLVDMHKVTSKKLTRSTDYDFILTSIRDLLGDFVGINDYRYDPSNQSQVQSAEAHCFSDMYSFMSGHYSVFLDNLMYSFEKESNFKPIYLHASTFYRLTSITKDYNGLDLLEAQEGLFEDLCSSIGDEWAIFSEKAITYQIFIESFYLNQEDSVSFNGMLLTKFDDAHPCIKTALLCNAFSQLKVSYIVEAFKGKSIDGDFQYSTVDLVNKINHDLQSDSTLFYEIASLMDIYLAKAATGE